MEPIFGFRIPHIFKCFVYAFIFLSQYNEPHITPLIYLKGSYIKSDEPKQITKPVTQSYMILNPTTLYAMFSKCFVFTVIQQKYEANAVASVYNY